MATDDELRRYADLLLRVGVAADDSRRITVRAHVESTALVRALVARAYELGVPRVDVLWTDPVVDVLHATLGPPGAVEVEPAWTRLLNEAVERGDAFIRIGGGEHPELEGLAGQRHETITRRWRTAAGPAFERLRGDEVPWLVACYPTRDWAQQVFPDAEDAEDAVEQLWGAIARVSRLDADDPVAAWRAHTADLSARARHVTSLDLVELEYRGPGTDLRVGVAGRRWAGGAPDQWDNVPNLPTEEVFTSPHCDHVQGTLALTKPYVFAGEAIAGAVLTFEDGVVTDAVCDEGGAALRRLLDTDEGSRRLGEVALVPHSSRVAAEQLQWRHPLYDENEDCHVALGMSYTFTAPDAAVLDADGLRAIGLNHSDLHEDVVVGSGELDVTGIDRHGGRHPLLAGGEWAFDPAGSA